MKASERSSLPSLKVHREITYLYLNFAFSLRDWKTVEKHEGGSFLRASQKRGRLSTRPDKIEKQRFRSFPLKILG